MCILAGCDFLKALSKIGIKKAHGHIRKFKTFVRVCYFLGQQPASHHKIWSMSAIFVLQPFPSVMWRP